jgi:hypothetical protein
MRYAALTLALLCLVGCSAAFRGDAMREADLPRYRHPGGAKLTLITVLSTQDGSGAHSALIVNGAQRVIFDPAGSLSHASLAERGDVIYGANPAVVDSYIDYHTRNTHDTVAQTRDVTDAVAGDLLARVMVHGPVMQSFCAQNVSALLRDTPGFEAIGPTFFPKTLMERFAALPGVRTVRFSQPEDRDKRTDFYGWIGQKPKFNIE